MRRKELQDIIDRELDNFIEFPDDHKEAVTVASCKLFAEHVVGVIQARPAVPDDWNSQARPAAPSRDDVIQCLLATNSQSEGITADAIMGLFKPRPTVQGEPVGWQFYQDGKWWHGYDRIKDHRKNTEEAGFPVRDLYATPQPYPGASALVEALELALEYWRHRQQRYRNRRPKWVIAAESALAAYQQGGEV